MSSAQWPDGGDEVCVCVREGCKIRRWKVAEPDTLQDKSSNTGSEVLQGRLRFIFNSFNKNNYVNL